MSNGEVTFIRIPKNASTSMYAFLGDKNTIKNELLCADNNMYLNTFEPSHCSISDAENKLGPGILDVPVLAIVRNPFDRLVSMYFFAKKYNLGSIYSVSTNDFQSFAKDFYKLSKDKNFFHGMSQKSYIKHKDSDKFNVIRFEKINNGVHSFVRNTGTEKIFNASEFPELNGTEHDHYSKYYCPKSKKIVRDMWGCDLDRFSYSFNYD